ncbi:hypothetical protein Taro_026972 [Colocasia esculenta]|uniref:Aminotransferase class V domain-containing protein n=1 Tax=Colocasia esculenta TaxID=4460 RepID=A0A843VL53_COLES|nr:hypothetical protein [Colocasia esculenta]
MALDHDTVNGYHDEEEAGAEANGLPAPKKARWSLITAEEIRREFAHHDPRVARVNNGSFGCCPASILAEQRRLQDVWLRQPDAFFYGELRRHTFRSREAVRSLINAADVEEVSLVDNATTAAAVVFGRVQRALYEGVYSRGDAVVMLHYAYGSVKRSAQEYMARAGAEIVEVPLPFPVRSEEEVVVEFRRALEAAKDGGRRKVRLAVIDHITSMPSVVIPVKRLTKICREEGVDQVFVDAAHAIGSVEVDMEDIGADFYTSNLYKWFFCPPSAAFLYSRKSTTSHDLHHPVVSSEYGKGLPIESAWVGARDYTPQLVVPQVVEFVNRFEGGLEGIRSRNHEKVLEMGTMLVEAWGTCVGSPPEMCGSMVMVGLPSCLGVASERDAQKLRRHLREVFLVEVPIYYSCPHKDGEATPASESCTDHITGFVRISHQVYNVVDDYHRLRDAVNKLVKDGFTCRALPSN